MQILLILNSFIAFVYLRNTKYAGEKTFSSLESFFKLLHVLRLKAIMIQRAVCKVFPFSQTVT